MTARAADLAPLIRRPAAAGGELIPATVVTWDGTDGYQVRVLGVTVAVTAMLAGAAPSPGDTVLAWRQPAAVLVIGVITTPA